MTRKEEREQAARNFESIEYNSPYTNFIQGAEWADKTMLDKVCKWIEENYALYEGIPGYFVASIFRKEIEE